MKSKIEPKVWDGIHVGYNPGNAYRCYIPKLGRVFVSKDVTFIEKLYRYTRSISFEIAEDIKVKDTEDDDNIPSNDNLSDENSQNGTSGEKKMLPWIIGQPGNDDNLEQESSLEDCSEHSIGRTRSGRKVKKPDRYRDIIQLAFMTAEAMTGNVTTEETSSPEEATSGINGTEWSKSMMDEIKSLIANDLFDIVKKPDKHKIVQCSWVYAQKKGSNGSIHRYKSRLVAKGYSKVKDIDYGKAFAPVVRFDTIRFLLAHASKRNMELKEINVKRTFLYGTLDEEIFMNLPPLLKPVIKLLEMYAVKIDGNDSNIIQRLLSAFESNDGQWALRLRR